MAEHDLENNFVSTLTELSGELTRLNTDSLILLYPKINKNEAYEILNDKHHANRFFSKLLENPRELQSTNVDGLIRRLEQLQLIKAAGILKRYKSRNANLINKEIERQEQEEQPVASCASSSTAKSPPSRKGDRTEEQPVASSASSSTAKSPPSQKGDRTEEQPVASSASSSTAKSPPSQKGDRTDVKNKLFISFSSKNEKMVKELVRRIESVVGLGSCWMYTYENLPGDNLPQNIVNAINGAKIMLCMITQDYIDSKPCVREFGLADELGKHIIPLHLKKVQVPYKQTNMVNSQMQLAVTDKVYARMYENPQEEFKKLITKINECLFGRNANASGETLVAPGSPSTSGSRKRKSSHDGDDSEVKVTRKE